MRGLLDAVLGCTFSSLAITGGQAMLEARGQGDNAPSFVNLSLEEVAVEGYGPFRWVSV
jgi:urocanate hydratase